MRQLSIAVQMCYASESIRRGSIAALLQIGPMTLSRTLFLVMLPVLLTSATFASKQKTEAAALIEQAKQLSDIRAEGAVPFRLKMGFKIINDDGGVMDGTYTEIWVSKTQCARKQCWAIFEEFKSRQVENFGSSAAPQWSRSKY